MTTNTAGWPTTIAVITLVTDDLQGTVRFYRDVFKMEPVHGDDDSTVFRFGETLINLLRTEAAPEAASAGYQPLADAFQASVAAYVAAVRAGDAAGVQTAISGLKPAYSKFFVEFG